MSDLSISDLSVSYGSGPYRFRALDSVNLSVASGTFVTLLGPSGSGKTTLLRCVAGLSTPSSGRIDAGDRCFYEAISGRGLPTRQRNLGMVFQSFALWPHMSVADNVAFPLRMRGWDVQHTRGRVAELLDRVGLPDHGRRFPGQLSGGQQQRVGLARAIACEPTLLLMDEPLSSLDARLREEMRSYIRGLQKELGITVIYVTHDREEALGLSDSIVILSRGSVMAVGTPRELFARPPDAFTATFLAGWNQVGSFDDLAARADAPWIKELASAAEPGLSAESIVVVPTDFRDFEGLSYDAVRDVPASLVAVEFLGSVVRIEAALAGINRSVFVALSGAAAAEALQVPLGARIGLPQSAFRVLPSRVAQRLESVR